MKTKWNKWEGSGWSTAWFCLLEGSLDRLSGRISVHASNISSRSFRNPTDRFLNLVLF